MRRKREAREWWMGVGGARGCATAATRGPWCLGSEQQQQQQLLLLMLMLPLCSHATLARAEAKG